MGDDPKKQKIDGVKYKTCPLCGKGSLVPYFKWWRYFFMLKVPLRFYIIGKPSEYRCTKCGNIITPKRKSQLNCLDLTRISYTQQIPGAFALSYITFFVFWVLVLASIAVACS